MKAQLLPLSFISLQVSSSTSHLAQFFFHSAHPLIAGIPRMGIVNKEPWTGTLRSTQAMPKGVIPDTPLTVELCANSISPRSRTDVLWLLSCLQSKT